MSLVQTSLRAADYDLAATLTSGQAFRWQFVDNMWEGVIGSHWVRLEQNRELIVAHTAGAPSDDRWLREYLQLDIDLSSILLSFSDDEPMRLSVTACRGLRLLRQDPWECLASFILSSTKQIVQIQQIVRLVCERFGEPVLAPPLHAPVYSFPTASRLASCSEANLRECKMGFRAPYLRGAARMVVNGEIDLNALHNRSVDEAREELLKFPGVGRKIADCVLLFAYGFQQAFPMDVWILKALRQLYFPKRKVTMKRLIKFSQTYFGPYAGYAQQYLFHYMRTKHSSPKGDK